MWQQYASIWNNWKIYIFFLTAFWFQTESSINLLCAYVIIWGWFRAFNKPNLPFFSGNWVEFRVPEKAPHKHGEDIKIPHGEDIDTRFWDSRGRGVQWIGCSAWRWAPCCKESPALVWRSRPTGVWSTALSHPRRHKHTAPFPGIWRQTTTLWCHGTCEGSTRPCWCLHATC